MRVLQFEIPGQGRRVGVVEGERVRDLTALNGSLDRVFAVFEAAVDALKQGQMNKALASLAALFPSSVWDAIKQAMHIINWASTGGP